MARILLIDSNPDNRKSLEGLFRYRTRHEFHCATSQTEGARKAVSSSPDLIMMNALLFMGKNYVFPRVMQQHEKTEHISFLVHATGRLDDVTQKQIQASGMATIVYLPVSAEELEAAIDEALRHIKPTGKQGIAPVVWEQASHAESQNTIRSQPKKAQPKSPNVQPVQWPEVPSFNQKEPAQPKPKKKAFQNLADRAPRPQNKQSGFRSAEFEQIDDEPTKGKRKFTDQRWENVDPKDVKNARKH